MTLASSSSLDRSQASGPVVSSSNQQHHQRLCYNCGQPGHISNICPLKHHRKHHGNGAGSGTIRFESIRCFECGEMGHYRTECPKMQERGDYGGYHRLMETDAQFATEQRQEAPVVGGLVAASYHVGSPAETTETVQANWNPTRPFYLETIQEADDVPSSSIAAQEPRLTASPREVGVESRILALEADQVAKAASIIELGKSLGVHVQITMDNETVQWTLGIKGTKAALLEFERSLGSMLGNESKGDAPGGTQDWFKPWDLDATKQHRPAEQTLNLRKNMAKSPSSDDTEHLRQLPKDVAVQKICHRWNVITYTFALSIAHLYRLAKIALIIAGFFTLACLKVKKKEPCVCLRNTDWSTTLRRRGNRQNRSATAFLSIGEHAIVTSARSYISAADARETIPPKTALFQTKMSVHVLISIHVLLLNPVAIKLVAVPKQWSSVKRCIFAHTVCEQIIR